ncbi:MAG: hypothetical protein IKI28_05385, partial [Bacteroidales bacterium]|nr:hypothetical protein [Bacteroidales bacterium]
GTLSRNSIAAICSVYSRKRVSAGLRQAFGRPSAGRRQAFGRPSAGLRQARCCVGWLCIGGCSSLSA